MSRKTVLSLMRATGRLHLGNYLGALRQWVSGQHTNDAFHGIVDLHALTVTDTPGTCGPLIQEAEDGTLHPDQFVPVIRRNTKLPAEKSDVFHTIFADQQAVVRTAMMRSQSGRVQHSNFNCFLTYP